MCVLEERRGVKNIEFLRIGSPMLNGSACWFTSIHCNRVNGAMGPGNVACRVDGFVGSREKIYNSRMGLIESKAPGHTLFIRRKGRARKNMRMQLP